VPAERVAGRLYHPGTRPVRNGSATTRRDYTLFFVPIVFSRGVKCESGQVRISMHLIHGRFDLGWSYDAFAGLLGKVIEMRGQAPVVCRQALHFIRPPLLDRDNANQERSVVHRPRSEAYRTRGKLIPTLVHAYSCSGYRRKSRSLSTTMPNTMSAPHMPRCGHHAFRVHPSLGNQGVSQLVENSSIQ
jgi:hypothetical protein